MRNHDREDHKNYDPTSTKEINRNMPRGVRGWLQEHINGTPLEDLPGPILNWLTNRGAITVSKSFKSHGKLVFTKNGQNALNQLKKQGTGYRN